MDIGATRGDEAPEGGAAFADERAASLRRMFPAGRRPAISPPQVLAALDAMAEPVPAAPSQGRGRWWLVAVAGVLAAAAAGAVVAFRPPDGRPLAAPWRPPTVPPEASVTPSLASSPVVSRPPATPVASRKPSPRKTVTTRATTAPATGPITAYGACASDTTATFAATFTEAFTWRHVFIDTDGDAGTGYRVPTVSGLGADYMIENGTLYRSGGPSWSWAEVRDVEPLIARSGGTYRWRTALAALGSPDGTLRVVFNGSGGGDEAYTPVLPAGGC